MYFIVPCCAHIVLAVRFMKCEIIIITPVTFPWSIFCINLFQILRSYSSIFYSSWVPQTCYLSSDGLRKIVNKCLRGISNIKWTDKITNEELCRITHQKLIENQIKIRKWNCIGHTLRKETGATEKTALDWNPQGYRRRGRPKRTWRRTKEDEIGSTRRSWNEVKGIVGNRIAWKLFMDALCSTRSKRI